MERRVVDARLEVRQGDAGEGSTKPAEIVGYAAVFNSLSQVLWGFREQIAPGAFTDALGDDVRALWNHDPAYVLGRTTAGTLRLAEDATGLRVEIDPPATALAQSFVESIRRGDVNQMSFGFSVLEDEWDESKQLIRTLHKVKLYEVSPVAFPAYPATEVGLRALWGDLRSTDPIFATRNGTAMDTAALRKMINRCAMRGGALQPTVHKFRQRFAINDLRNGGSVLELQRMLGHVRLDTVWIYASLAEADLQEAQKRASPADNWKF